MDLQLERILNDTVTLLTKELQRQDQQYQELLDFREHGETRKRLEQQLDATHKQLFAVQQRHEYQLRRLQERHETYVQFIGRRQKQKEGELSKEAHCKAVDAMNDADLKIMAENRRLTKLTNDHKSEQETVLRHIRVLEAKNSALLQDRVPKNWNATLE